MADRQLFAFLLAPAIAPLIALIWLPAGGFFTLMFGLLAGYGGMFVIGIPLFLILRLSRWRTWWVAAGVGLLSGMLMWFATMAFFVLSLGEALPSFKEIVASSAWREGAIWPGGVAGMLVGLVFWLIARPDRSV